MIRAAIALIGWEDEGERGMGDHLERRGFVVERAPSVLGAERLIADKRIDLAVLGPALSSTEALDMLRMDRHGAAPLFVLVGRDEDMVEKVLALEAGAADFVPLDIVPRELAARLGRLAARLGLRGGDLMMLENSTVDLSAALVMHRSGREESLSPGQVTLLRLFAERPSMVLSREDIIAAAPAEDTDAFDRSIDSRIARLRRKLDTETIATVRGSGYRFDPPRASKGAARES